MITTLRTRTLHGALTGLQALAKQVHQQVRDQLESEVFASHGGARESLAEAETRLFALVEGVRTCLERLEGSESVVQETLAAALGTAAGWLESMRSDEVASRWLRDDMAALWIVRVQLQMAEVIASELDDRQSASELHRHRVAVERCLSQLDELLPEVLKAELRAEGKAPDREASSAHPEERL